MDIDEDKEDPRPMKRSRHSCQKKIMAPPAENWDEEDIIGVYGSEYGVDDEVTQTADINADSDDPTWGLLIIRQVDPILDFISHYSRPKSVCFCEKQLTCWMGGAKNGNRV
jgi:hypothetical protein